MVDAAHPIGGSPGFTAGLASNGMFVLLLSCLGVRVLACLCLSAGILENKLTGAARAGVGLAGTGLVGTLTPGISVLFLSRLRLSTRYLFSSLDTRSLAALTARPMTSFAVLGSRPRLSASSLASLRVVPINACAATCLTTFRLTPLMLLL
jgi:hypothetical protein